MFRDKSQAVCELTLSCQGAGGERRLILARSDGFDLRILNSKFDLGILRNFNENDEKCLSPLQCDPLGGVRGFRLPYIFWCYVTKFAPHLAPKAIA